MSEMSRRKFLQLLTAGAASQLFGCNATVTGQNPMSESSPIFNGTVPQPENPEEPALQEEPYTLLHMQEAHDFLVNLEKEGALNRVKVGILDSGLMIEHEEFNGINLAGFKDYTKNRETVYDDNGHGTKVAGIIAGIKNGKGALGFCLPSLCDLYIYKVLDVRNSGNPQSVIAALTQANIDNVEVINMSLGSTDHDLGYDEPIHDATIRNATVVASVGNVGSETLFYPAAIDEVIAIGAIDQHLTALMPSSNYGDYNNHFVAPGEGLITSSISVNMPYGPFSLTSAAAPFMTGIIVGMRSIDPALTNEKILNILKMSAIDIGEEGKDNRTGYGYVDPLKAFELTLELKDTEDDLENLPANIYLPLIQKN